MCIRYFAFGALLFPLLGFASQDTLRVTMRQADSLLQIRSLDLVVQRYEINKAEAERIQARLFSNPQIGTEWSVNPPSGHFFDVGRNGEKAFTVEQLFQIAGQRSLAMKGAGKRVEMSTAEYAEFAAALRLRLHSALLQQFYSQRALDAISSQMALFHTVVDAYGGQYEKGNVSLKEVTRLRTTYFMLNAKSKHDDFVRGGCETAPSSGCTGLQGDGQSAQTSANVGLGVTAIFAVATVVVGAVFTRWHGPSNVALAPSGPGGATAALSF